MGSLQQQEAINDLVEKICEIYDNISKLPTLKPSRDVNRLFTELVMTCIPPSSIDVTHLPVDVQSIRAKLIRLCGEAEGHLESHYSTLLGAFDNPLDHLTLFPYFNNYLKLSQLEHNILAQHSPLPASAADHVAFIGSGPMPLTSIVLAKHHMRSSTFHNYDIEPSANAMAQRLVSLDPELSMRMVFHTADIMDVTGELRDYKVVFLAALVGMDVEEKRKVLDHLARYMAPGAVLMLRSAAGARAFLYPVINPCDLRGGFEVLSVYHPTDEVINSVIIARKKPQPMEQENGNNNNNGTILLPCKCCSKIQAFNHGSMMDEQLVLEEQAS